MIVKLRKDAPPQPLAPALPSHPLFGGGSVGILSGENPRFPSIMQGGHEALGQELARMGLTAEPTEGHYGSPERSYIVYGPTRQQMIELGQKFGQESVIHSQGGNHQLIYTNGEHAGKHHAGKGWEFYHQKPDDFFTSLPPRGGVKGYFRMPFDFDSPPQEHVEAHDVAKQLGKALRERIERYQDELVALRKKEMAKEEKPKVKKHPFTHQDHKDGEKFRHPVVCQDCGEGPGGPNHNSATGSDVAKADMAQMAPHQEPGVHEQSGRQHAEPGVHEKFAVRAPSQPESISQKSEPGSSAFKAAWAHHKGEMEKGEMSDYKVPLRPCKGCTKPMNPVEVLLSGSHGNCGKCVRAKHAAAVGGAPDRATQTLFEDPEPQVLHPSDRKVKKQEDMIDRTNESEPGKRIKEVGATKGRRIPSDGIKEMAAQGEGSGGKVKKNPLSKEERPTHCPKCSQEKGVAIPKDCPHKKKPEVKKSFSAKPTGVPGAPKPPQAAGAKPSMHKGDFGMTDSGKQAQTPAAPAPSTPAPKQSAAGIRGTPIKSELSKAVPMSGMAKMPKEAQAQAAQDSFKAGVTATVPPEVPARAQPKPTDAYDPSQFMSPTAPKAKQAGLGRDPGANRADTDFNNEPGPRLSPIAAHLKKLAKQPKPTFKSEAKAEMCKACGGSMEKNHKC